MIVTKELPPDWKLVVATQAGDMTAYAELWQDHRFQVFGLIYQMCPVWATAEELTSETFTRSLESINTLEYQGKDFLAWLYTVAKNAVRDHVRKKDTRQELITDPAHMPDQAVSDVAVSRVINGDVATEVAWAVDRLPGNQGRAIRYRYFDDMMPAEIMALTGWTRQSTTALIHRGKQNLARELSRFCSEY